MGYLKDFIFGIILGIANIIPGVSGGTMAVILNIYDKILYAISLQHIKRSLSFLIPLALGCCAGVFVFSKAMITLLDNYEMVLKFCFIGLIIGSAPMIYKRAHYEKVKGRNAAIFFVALGFMLLLAILSGSDISNKSLAQLGGLSPLIAVWLFVAAALSTIAMILPGISGSFIMLLLGVYTIAIEAIANLDILVMIPVGLGVLLGAFIGVKFIKKMLRFHPQALYFGILGLILGSIYIIWPSFTANAEGIISLLLMAAFAALAYFFSLKSD